MCISLKLTAETFTVCNSTYFLKTSVALCAWPASANYGRQKVLVRNCPPAAASMAWHLAVGRELEWTVCPRRVMLAPAVVCPGRQLWAARDGARATWCANTRARDPSRPRSVDPSSAAAVTLLSPAEAKGISKKYF